MMDPFAAGPQLEFGTANGDLDLEEAGPPDKVEAGVPCFGYEEDQKRARKTVTPRKVPAQPVVEKKKNPGPTYRWN